MPPVVDRNNGRVACGTTSTGQGCCTPRIGNKDVRCYTRVFSEINENGGAYFDDRPAPTLYEPRLQRRATTRASSAVVSFPTPFVYLPCARAVENLDNFLIIPRGPCDQTLRAIVSRPGCSPDQIIGESGYKYGNRPANIPSFTDPRFNDNAENFGHVLQAVLGWMLKDARCAAQFPGLASRRPGGPEIKPTNLCLLTPSPAYVEVVSALTVATKNVVDGPGCFHPGACPTISTYNNQAGPPAIVSAQVTADFLQFGDSGTVTSDRTSPISQDGVASNAPSTLILPSQAVSEPAGGTSEPPGESSADEAPIDVDQIAAPENTPQPQTPAAGPQGVDVGSITSIATLDDQNVVRPQTPAPGSSTVGVDDSTYSNPKVTMTPIGNGSPSLLGQATLSSGDISSRPQALLLTKEGTHRLLIKYL